MEHRIIVNYFLAIPLLLLFGCARELEHSEYITWVRDYDNGLHVRKEFDEFIFDLQYQPESYLSIIDNSKGGNFSDSIQYFILNISLTDSLSDPVTYTTGSLEDKQKRLYYFSYQFQEDITLEENGVQHPCLLFHFQQSSSSTGARTFLLAFENRFLESKEAKLIIQSELFGSLPIKIRVSKENPRIRTI